MSLAYTIEDKDIENAFVNAAVSSINEVYVTVKNTGTTTWSKTGSNPVRLGTQNATDHASAWRDPDDARWLSSNRIEMEEDTVAPNETATFRFNIRGKRFQPQPTGWPSVWYPSYGAEAENFRMVKEGVGWFTGSPLITWTWVHAYVEWPYSGETNAFKGQLHCHTTASDGDSTPSDQVTAYKNLGYDFIALTDHSFDTPDPQVAGITFIRGVEERYTGSEPHICVWGDVDAPDYSAGIEKTAERHSANALMSLAHPQYTDFPVSQTFLDNMQDIRFIEVFNGFMPSNMQTAQGKTISLYNRNRKMWVVAVDDAHADAHRNKGWVVVHAASNTQKDILDAMRKGDFYASSGSALSLSLSGRKITATSPNAGTFKFIGSDYSNPLKTATNTAGGSVDYTIGSGDDVVWVKHEKTGSNTATDCAWAQPIYIRS